jgi:fucose permease
VDPARVEIAAGVGIGTVWTNSDALVGASASPSQPGASIGVAQSFKEFGDMIGPLLVGALTQFFGVRRGSSRAARSRWLCLVCSRGQRLSDSRTDESHEELSGLGF